MKKKDKVEKELSWRQKRKLPLTPRQETFCQLFANPSSGDVVPAKEAYLRAFDKCSDTYAAGSASRLLKNPRIAKRIQEIRNKTADRLSINAERVLQELASIAFAKMSDFATWNSAGEIELVASSELSPEDQAAIKEIVGDSARGRRIRLHDKGVALDKLAKYLGMFTEKVDVTSGGKPIEPLTDEERVARISEILERSRARRDGSSHSRPSEE